MVKKYEVKIPNEIAEFLAEVAESAEVTVSDILQDFIDDQIEDAKAGMVIDLYKKDKLKAREAWKLSGLSYQEFQSRAKSEG